MSKDPVNDQLLNVIFGLQGVVVALSSTLIKKGVLDKESLLLNLEAYSEQLAQNPDQAEVFQSVKRTLEGGGVWIPRVVEGGKSDSPAAEDDPEAD